MDITNNLATIATLIMTSQTQDPKIHDINHLPYFLQDKITQSWCIQEALCTPESKVCATKATWLQSNEIRYPYFLLKMR